MNRYPSMKRTFMAFVSTLWVWSWLEESNHILAAIAVFTILVTLMPWEHEEEYE